VFTKQVQDAMTDEEYRELQLSLVARPDQGAVIAGTGGLRKVRWGTEGRGKRGGVRVIYYWATEEGVIFLLLLYPKNEQDDLTEQQKRALRNLVEAEFG
jgi:hypothetical protein